MAEIATGSRDEALDLVQEAMLKLVEKYADRTADEWPPLFYRIMESRIRDWHRRRAIRTRVFAWLRPSSNDGAPSDPMAEIPDAAAAASEEHLAAERFGERLEMVLGKLPLKQQQVFLLRAWEGLDVKQTAHAMGCSEGTAKTHYYRAVRALRAYLGEGRP
jgi:RNA polymerase sigma-70 factor (ECF subfamily)